MTTHTDTDDSTHDPGAARAYGVRLLAAWSHQAYQAWCDCGWEGDRLGSHEAAAVAAVTHATGREPDPVARLRRFHGPVQTEALFDAREYDR